MPETWIASDSKQKSLDAGAGSRHGTHVHIFVIFLIPRVRNIRMNLQYYTARMYVDQIRSGDDYAKLTRAISIICSGLDLI